MKGGRESKAFGGGGGGGAPPSADLLVCFPSRARLSLMPKPICSPNSEPNRRLKKINTRGRTTAAGGGPVSPLLWAKGKQMSGGPEITEPTSPKVTCAGQIKVRPRSSTATGTCRNWQSVMEEIERLHSTRSKHIHNNSSSRKSKHWAEALGFKKDIVNFLTCLGNLRFDFRCFGTFPDTDITSGEEEEDEEDEEEDEEEEDQRQHERNTVFSKWFMVLQENHNENSNGNSNSGKQVNANAPEDGQVVPPPNALLLMRCRSAPAKRSNGRVSEEQMKEEEEEIARRKELALVVEEKAEKKKRESLAIVMKYDPDFYNLSSDVSKETWLVDGFQDTFSRSRSWKR